MKKVLHKFITVFSISLLLVCVVPFAFNNNSNDFESSLKANTISADVNDVVKRNLTTSAFLMYLNSVGSSIKGTFNDVAIWLASSGFNSQDVIDSLVGAITIANNTIGLNNYFIDRANTYIDKMVDDGLIENSNLNNINKDYITVNVNNVDYFIYTNEEPTLFASTSWFIQGNTMSYEPFSFTINNSTYLFEGDCYYSYNLNTVSSGNTPFKFDTQARYTYDYYLYGGKYINGNTIYLPLMVNKDYNLSSIGFVGTTYFGFALRNDNGYRLRLVSYGPRYTGNQGEFLRNVYMACTDDIAVYNINQLNNLNIEFDTSTLNIIDSSILQENDNYIVGNSELINNVDDNDIDDFITKYIALYNEGVLDSPNTWQGGVNELPNESDDSDEFDEDNFISKLLNAIRDWANEIGLVDSYDDTLITDEEIDLNPLKQPLDIFVNNFDSDDFDCTDLTSCMLSGVNKVSTDLTTAYNLNSEIKSFTIFCLSFGLIIVLVGVWRTKK